VSLHSGLNDTERLQNWLCAFEGHADVVIGTRSSILAPMPRLGLIIIDEEHDGSLKQQDGFRYHARDLALMRARNRQCPVLLGTATPSFESLNNVRTGRFVELTLTQRAGDAIPPIMGLLDIRRRKLIEGMSDRLLDAIREHLANDGQALVFINRRGFAPTLLCNDCGAAADCRRCDAHMTVHVRQNRLRCHHCGAERPLPVVCDSCGSAELDRVGYGTERITEALQGEFPHVDIARIDRDSTRRKGALEVQLNRATSGQARILVGTQMLAKGHHFPKLTLVCILDADRGLFGTDFRSLEHMAQLIVQVAGRAGREKRRGAVLIQTRNPDNPMLQTLVKEGYEAFADIAMADRRLAELPPFSFMALVRAEASDAREAHAFLLQVAETLQLHKSGRLDVMGPAPAPMERLGGRYRAQLLLQSDLRSSLNDSLSRLCALIDQLPGARRCRWSIDVDPVDLF
jgi:primosomal protein N' (replication factor Y)